MADECSVGKHVETKPCSVKCTQDYTKALATATVKTTWTCSVHTPPDTCVIGELRRARGERDKVRNIALEDAAKALEGGSFLHGVAPDTKIALAGAAVIRKLKSK